MPWGVGMRDMLALSIHCQTNITEALHAEKKANPGLKSKCS